MEVKQLQILRFYLAFFLFLFMIFQNLIYGLFIYEIKDRFFFFFPKFKLGLKKRAQVHDKGVQICIARGSKQFFFNILFLYIYIYI